MTHRPEKVQAVRHRPNNTPFRNRDPARIYNDPRTSSRYVPDSNILYIGDLPLDVTEDQVRSMFQQFGSIVSVNIIRKRVEDSKQRNLNINHCLTDTVSS